VENEAVLLFGRRRGDSPPNYNSAKVRSFFTKVFV